jgi:hypothetical protein
MAKTLTPKPIMSPDEERFMAFEGWCNEPRL